MREEGRKVGSMRLVTIVQTSSVTGVSMVCVILEVDRPFHADKHRLIGSELIGNGIVTKVA
jgi:hypothetical protein